jgi:Ca2+-binding EF-hand superfamily protein
MTDGERAAIAERFKEFRKLPPAEKARIRQASRRFDAMTPEERQQLRQRFQNLSPQERARIREQLRNRPRPQQR